MAAKYANWYRSNIVAIQPVSFPSQLGFTVAGNLFTPKSLAADTKAPAIVVGHPHGATKEQSANLYATKLAEQGFVTLSIDLAGWGASGGVPRNGVVPDLYVETFRAAVDYLGLQKIVDRARIGALGVCGSGSFAVSAAKIDSRIKAVTTVSMYDMGAATRDSLFKSQSLEQRKAMIEQTSLQRWVEAEGGEVQYGPMMPYELPDGAPPILVEFWEYYRTSRGEYTPVGSTRDLNSRPTVVTAANLLNFYPFNDIETISPRPLLFISGDQAHSREFSEDAYARAAEPKELFWVAGASHVDLYDRVDVIPFAKIFSFFEEALVSK